MNLVIDDAVEVAQITKTNDKETRRPLGMHDNWSLLGQKLTSSRPNLAEGRQRITDPEFVKLNLDPKRCQTESDLH